MTGELLELGKYGIIGVFIALIGFALYVIKLYNTLANNHIQHGHDIAEKNTEAMVQLKDTVREVKELIIRLKP